MKANSIQIIPEQKMYHAGRRLPTINNTPCVDTWKHIHMYHAGGNCLHHHKYFMPYDSNSVKVNIAFV